MTERRATTINSHALEKLEFPKVIEQVAGKCLTPYGAELVRLITPMHEPLAIDRRLSEVSQLLDLLRFGAPFPLVRQRDCRQALEQSTVSGGRLDPAEILTVLELIVQLQQLTNYEDESRAKAPFIDEQLRKLRSHPDLKKEIEQVLDPLGEVKDSASPALRKIRSELSESRTRLLRKLEQLMQGRRKQAGWQDDVVTTRNGRYVIPVPSSTFSSNIGILHDRSQTGATLYVEPSEAVELNNRLQQLQQDERQEVDRILRELTALIGAKARELQQAVAIIGFLDMLHASALYAQTIRGQKPKLLASSEVRLVEARHPILIRQLGTVEKVIPVTIALDESRAAIIITGPNTGGKTIALKTVGLLVLMTQAGLLIPASEKSEVGLFHEIFVDIGDEQSIELSLSTFSAHTRNVVEAVRAANSSSLILFDEIGAGTDPKEGAALAESVILALVRKGAKLITTTHYSQLKSLALEHPGIENASLEFDRETLSPTYRLHMGLPGSSFAVDIARRLGMPAEICEKASELLGSAERSLSELIETLQIDLAKLREDKTALSDKLVAATQLEELYKMQLERLKRETDEEKKRMLAETAQLLESTRKETERLVGEIRRTQADSASVKELHRKLREAADQVGEQAKKLEKQERETPGIFAEGDQVRITHLNQLGKIDELIGNDKARVIVGKLSMVVDLRQLQKEEITTSIRKKSNVSRIDASEQSSAEIHLRGMTVEVAMEELERFLDKAILSGRSQVYVIHGKGTGTLRRTLTEYLKSHKEVDSLRLGDWNEGGAGVTVVKLKS